MTTQTRRAHRAATRAVGVVGLAMTVALSGAAPLPPEPPPLAKPKPLPAHAASPEGVSALPAPAVLPKRQQRKNPPPSLLLTKIRTGDPEEWARAPDDLKGLLEFMSKEMNVRFSSSIKTFAQISTDPVPNPVLYRSGYRSFKLTPKELQVLRAYVANGGTIIFNALAGHPDFYRSALEAARQIVPEGVPYRLRADHPVFHSYYDINKVRYRERMVKDGLIESAVSDPHLEGVDIDNRTAIFISRWDFALGWEANPHASWGYSDQDARRIGANIITYATVMRDAGRRVVRPLERANAAQNTAGKLRVGQIIHSGLWKTRAAAFPMLLNQFPGATGTPVSFELREVGLSDPAIFEMPLLYLTGTTDFTLTGPERANLRRYLQNGGVLFAEASEGRASFHAAFTQEMAAVLPGQALEKLPATHPILTEPTALRTVKARAALAAKRGNQIEMQPEVFGIHVNGSLSVIYSPYDLSAGWGKAIAPYALGYEAADATALGLNVLFHAVAH